MSHWTPVWIQQENSRWGIGRVDDPSIIPRVLSKRSRPAKRLCLDWVWNKPLESASGFEGNLIQQPNYIIGERDVKCHKLCETTCFIIRIWSARFNHTLKVQKSQEEWFVLYSLCTVYFFHPILSYACSSPNATHWFNIMSFHIWNRQSPVTPHVWKGVHMRKWLQFVFTAGTIW